MKNQEMPFDVKLALCFSHYLSESDFDDFNTGAEEKEEALTAFETIIKDKLSEFSQAIENDEIDLDLMLDEII